MALYGVIKIEVPAIVHEEEPLPRSPKRSCAELVSVGLPLTYPIAVGPHGVERKIRIRSEGLIA
jgi:hypothetical protein